MRKKYKKIVPSKNITHGVRGVKNLHLMWCGLCYSPRDISRKIDAGITIVNSMDPQAPSSKIRT